jgi:uncharacterized protein (DUF885 family)
MRDFFLLCLLSTALIGAVVSHIPPQASRASVQVDSLADEYVSLRLEYDPTLAIAMGLPYPSEVHFPDRRQVALRRFRDRENVLLTKLKSIGLSGTKELGPTYSVLLEELESRRGLRVCRSELWDLSQTDGWQIELPDLAATQPVGTPEGRRSALSLWSTFPTYLQTDMENLRAGLASGYSVPKPIVTRVLRQLDGLLSASPEDSPFYSPAKRANDPLFARAVRQEIVDWIAPALQKYAKFLRSEYLPRARESLGLSAIPNGAACYQAYLRRYTTTDYTPEFVFASGKEIVAESTGEIQSVGSRLYQTTSIPEIIQRSHADPMNRFASPEELIQFSRGIVDRSEKESRDLFLQFPSQPVAVEPLAEYQRGSGVGTHYQANPNDEEAATFWISIDHWRDETRGAAEITAVHETVPGHHLQIAIARRLQAATNLARLATNAAYVEGWANYAERLSEEQDIDGDGYERIQRRVVAGRSLVIDPGVHAFGWSRQKAEAFGMETGMSTEQADDLIDRIAVEPGQLTSYEVGGLEIASLRELARRRLGTKFDLRAFHQCVLEQGAIPLSTLRSHVIDWIERRSLPN